jgi:hypothetical protein
VDQTVIIQIQDVGGNWMDVQTTMTNHDRYVYSLMEQAQRNYSGRRVRAVDQNGRIIDILG